MNRRQTIPAELRYTFQQFDKDFPNDDACLEQIKEQRFPGGVTNCRKCENKPRKTLPRAMAGRPTLVRPAGTTSTRWPGRSLRSRATKLRIWFHTMYLMGSTRCGISAKQIQRETGVTYKCAWRMFTQIRKLMHETHVILGDGPGGVEIDEAYFTPDGVKSDAGRRLRGDKGPQHASAGRGRAQGPHRCAE